MNNQYFKNPPKFKPNDKVRIISGCATYGCHGIVVSYINYPPKYGKRYVKVKLNRGGYQNYNEKSLSLVGSTNNTTDLYNDNECSDNEIMKGENKMANEVQGNYRIAMVRHVQNCANHNTVKVYAFALFNDNIVIGDKVLCDSEGGYSVAEVIDIKSKMEYSQAHSRVVTKEIICKVDFSEFDERAAKRREAAAIRAEMDKLVAENQDMILYQAIAEKNPQMAILLERFKAINNI